MTKRQKQNFKQIIYTSKPVAFEENTIDEILASSHKYNSESGVTGFKVVLVFRPVCSLVKMDQGFISGC